MALQLLPVHPNFVHKAWDDGAHMLSRACEKANGEVTADQLRLRLARGELQLLLLRDGDGPALAWVAVTFENQPNGRYLFVYAIWAPGATLPEAFDLLCEFGRSQGAQRIRGACDEAVARLWERRFNFRKAYTIMERDL